MIYFNFAYSLVNDYNSKSKVKSCSLILHKSKQNNGRPNDGK